MADGVVHVFEPRPRDVDGFAEALAAGRLPRVPRTPPPLLPGETAGHRFAAHWVTVGVAVLLWLLVVRVVDELPLPALLHGLLVLTGGLALFWYAFLRVPRAFGERTLAELAQGYTTLTWTLGHVATSTDGRFRRRPGVPWRYAGVWVLDAHGRVKAVPDPAVEPPGFFPSPNRPGAMELWTGCAWSGLYREEPAAVRTRPPHELGR